MRLETDNNPFSHVIVVLFALLVLFMALPIAIYGVELLLFLSGVSTLTAIAIFIEKKNNHNRAHLILFTPFMFMGALFYISAVATMYAGDRMHGVWLIPALAGAAHILIFNVLIAYFLDADAAIESMKKAGSINIADGRYFFMMPSFADERIGLPRGLVMALWTSRIFFLAVCVFGAVAFGPGLYSSVGAYERLLNGAGTIQIGMGVLMARLWHFPLAVAVQRKFENLPADKKFLEVA